jgi:predicted DNA-binding transcriptional regulator AlpA
MQIELTDEDIVKIAEAVAQRIKPPVQKAADGAMNIKEVAQYIGKSVVSVRRLIRKDRTFPLPRGEGKFSFDRKEVEIWWKNQKNKAEKIFRPL